MDFKKSLLVITSLVLIILIASCNEKVKSNIKNTFYVELVNFNHDSLKQAVAEKIFGKVAYYKGDKLDIISVNYLTEDYPDMHFFKNAGEINKNIEAETKKIRVEFGGVYTNDSITYSLQKFVYRNSKWIKTSDMGFLKATNTFFRAKEFSVKQYSKEIVNNIVVYSFN